MAHPGVVEQRRVALRAGREVCGGGDEEAVHAGQGDAVAAAGLVPAPQALQCAIGACFHQALGPQPLATGLVDSNAHVATTLLTPTLASPVSKNATLLSGCFFSFALSQLCSAQSAIAWHGQVAHHAVKSF